MSLMYNPAEDNLINRQGLHSLPMPAKLGRFHQPYAFGDYVENIHEALDMEGLLTVEEEYAVTKDGNRMFGMIKVKPLTGEFIGKDDYAITLGVRGSHDQSIARGIALGTSVMVCSNLCFHGNMGNLRTKQTTNIAQRIPALIRDAVAHVPEQVYKQGKTFDMYKDMELKPRVGDAALVELYRRDAFSGSQLATAIAEWDKSTYEEHEAHGASVWKLFNASTQALKPTGRNVNMELIRERSEVVSGFMNEIVGL